MAHGCDDSASLPDVLGDGLKPSGGRIIIESSMACGTEEQPVILCFQICRFLQLRIQLHIERVLRVLEDGLIVTGQEPIGKREIIEAESTGLASKVNVETG